LPTPPQGRSADTGQNRPADRAQPTQPTPSPAHGGARPGPEFHRRGSDRIGDAIFRALARTGTGPAHLLTTRGRKTGRLRTNPVVLVTQDRQQWLVAPYGAVSWVLNARAAGQVTLRRGRHSQTYTIRELPAAEAGPILQRYVDIAPATRAYFHASKNSPVAEFIAEADRHPVFELSPASRGRPGWSARG
jgi:deazaflavin-dependent oxidoreductase (nitroreductase family)